MTTDPIADMLTRIRNAGQARKRRVDIPCSRMKRRIAKLMEEQHFIKGFTIIDDNKQDILRVSLRYDRSGRPLILGLKRISRPGLRRYVGNQDLPWVYSGHGIALISTSRGIITDRAAREMKVGGEVLCHIW